MKYRICDLSGFKNYVFGADCFLENFPEIKTTGVELKKRADDFYYIMNDDGTIVDITTFFSEKEMVYLEPVTSDIKIKE